MVYRPLIKHVQGLLLHQCLVLLWWCGSGGWGGCQMGGVGSEQPAVQEREGVDV